MTYKFHPPRLLAILLFVFLLGALGVSAQKITSARSFNWQDDQGNPVNAHGAGVLFYNGMYYLYGEVKNGRTWLVPGQNWEDYRVPAGGISCYTSRDLRHWSYKGIVLAPVSGDSTSDIDTSRVIERPKVIYNPRTGQFVMWMHLDKKDYSYARAGVAVSNSPEGPFRFIKSYRPNGQMARDMTLFKDNDNVAYLIYSSEDNMTMQVCRLTDNYLEPSTAYSRILVKRNREAPALFYYRKKYFLITSACTGWAPNAATLAIANHPMGPWQEVGNPLTGPGADSTFGCQSTYVLPLNERKGLFLFMADRWNRYDLPLSGYLWLPFKIKHHKVRIHK